MLRSLPHGHVAAVLGIARKIGLDRLLAALVLAMILARVPRSWPPRGNSTPRPRPPRSAHCWNWGPSASGNCMPRSTGCSASNHASRAASHGTLVLYDVSTTWFEGRTCPLARRGYSRDGKRDKLQIVFGLLCASDGCPVAVEVFTGNTGDPSTLAAQIAKLKQRFHLVVLVGDRGMITETRVEEVLKARWLRIPVIVNGQSVRS